MMNLSKSGAFRVGSDNRWRRSGAVGGMPQPRALCRPPAPAPAPAPAPVEAPKAAAPKTKARFGTRDLGKDATPRWGVVNKATKIIVDRESSRAKAQSRARILNAATT